MKDYDTSPVSPSVKVKTIVPVDALQHRLGDGVMPYLETHGVNILDLLMASLELCLMSEKQMETAQLNVTDVLYDRFANHVEMLEYNNQQFDPETFEMNYNDACRIIYDATHPYFRMAVNQAGVEDLRLPYPVGHEITRIEDSAGNLDAVYLEFELKDYEE